MIDLGGRGDGSLYGGPEISASGSVDAEKYLYEVNMGATAIGTGINVPKGYPAKCAAELATLTKKPIVPAKDMLAATWDQQAYVVYSSALKSVAVKLSKISDKTNHAEFISLNFAFAEIVVLKELENFLPFLIDDQSDLSLNTIFLSAHIDDFTTALEKR